MTKKIIFMYSGQGAQYYKMGEQLFNEIPVFRHWILKGDEIVQDYLKTSIVDILYDGGYKSNKLFDRTIYTSIAILMTEYALTRVLFENNIYPDYILGTSLGEMCAAAVAGATSFEDCITATISQSQIFKKTCKQGGMLAVLHNKRIFNEIPLIHKNSEFAADNFHSHFVVSGQLDQLKKIGNYLKENQINSVVLPVSFAFHSSFIDPAFSTYKEHFGRQKYLRPKIPIISSLLTKRINDYSVDYFWKIIREPIHFQKTIKNLEKENDYIYIDLGPSGTLSTHSKYNFSKESASESYPTMTPFGQDLKSLNKITERVKKNHSR